MFESPRCPQCQSRIDLAPLNRTTRRSALGLLPRGAGIDCPACGMPLVIDQRMALGPAIGAWVALAALFVFRITLRPGQPRELTGAEPFALIGVLLALIVFQLWLARRWVRLRYVAPGEAVTFPLRATPPSLVDAAPPPPARPAQAPSAMNAPGAASEEDPGAGEAADEDPDDGRDAAPDEDPPDTPAERAADAEVARVLSGPDWRCPACGEMNPGNFPECWKCQAIRPELTAPPGPAPGPGGPGGPGR